MHFNDIVGHRQHETFFKQKIQQGQLNHAYILEGPEGIGKATFAKTLARGLLCDAMNIDGCFGCDSCHKFDTNNHPDFLCIEPQGNSIKNEQIESFQSFVHIMPNESDYKVIVIDQAQTMTVSAQNRILKVLEEPPKYVIIFMIVDHASTLLPTINSRCQAVAFKPLSYKKMEAYLGSAYDLSDVVVEQLLSFSNGAIGKAKQMIDDETLSEHRQLLIGLTRAIADSNFMETLEGVKLLQNKEVSKQYLDILQGWYRDLLTVQSTMTTNYVINRDKKYELKKQVKLLDKKNIVKMINEIEQAKNRLAMNMNHDLIIDQLIIDLME